MNVTIQMKTTEANADFPVDILVLFNSFQVNVLRVKFKLKIANSNLY